MIYLDFPTKKLEVVLAGAVTTNQAEVSAYYYDLIPQSTTTLRRGGTKVTDTNSTTDVTIVAAPELQGRIRNVHTIFIHNKDTASITVTVKLDDSGTETIQTTVTLRTGETLVYEDQSGWSVITPVTINITSSAENADLTFQTAGTTVITLPLTGTMATLAGSETFTNKTITSPTINDGTTNLDGGTLILPQGTTPAQTAEGSVVWDTDDDVLTIGTGSDRVTLVDTGDVGSVFQAWDTALDDISGLAVTDSNIIVGNGTNWVAESGATARTSLGVAIGTNVQAWDTQLDDIAALAVTDSNFIVGNGTNWVAETGATARTSLGLGTIATQNANSVTISGGSVTGITDITVADGGTGVSTLADGGIVIGNAASAVEVLAPGATTTILVGGGAATAPVWTTATGSGEPVRATSPTLVTPALGTPASGVLTNCTGLPVAGGGTGASTLTDGGILLGSGTGAITPMAVLADGSIVVGDGATDPVALAAFTSSTGTLKHESGGLEFNAAAVADGDFIVGTGTGTMGLESGATARTSLGVAIGTNVQAWDANLDQIAALAVTDSNFIVGNGSAWVAEDAATARTSLGVGLTKLASGSASDDATVDIVMTSYTSYANKTLVIYNFVPATDNSGLWLRTSTDGGSTFSAGASDYKYAFRAIPDSTSGGDLQSAGAAQIGLANVGQDNTASTGGLQGIINVFQSTDTANPVFFIIHTTYYNLDSSNVYSLNGIGTRHATGDVDALRLLFASGNVTTGEWTLYGWN